MELKETITEMGLCYTYSGVVSNYISLRKNSWKTVEGFVPPYCNFLNSLCYARIEDFPRIMKYYIHSAYELPDISDRYFIVKPSTERDTTFRFQATVASDELRRLNPKQRRCRFMDEPTKDMASPVYSYNLCRMNCRKKLAYELCRCAPYFYPSERGIRVCGVRGLACLAKYASAVTTLKYPDGKDYPCRCYLTCTNTNFYLDKDNSRKWLYPVPCNIRFRWAIELYSKTRLKRDIIFGFEDLLVSFGGTAAFFLGCSVITFVELFYFFTLRLFWFLRSKHKT